MSYESALKRVVAQAVFSRGARNIRPSDLGVASNDVIRVEYIDLTQYSVQIKVVTQSQGSHYFTVKVAAVQ